MKKRLIFIGQKIKKVSPFYVLSLIVALVILVILYIHPFLQVYKNSSHTTISETIVFSCIVLYISSCFIGAVLMIWITLLWYIDMNTNQANKKIKSFIDKQEKYIEWFTAGSILS